MKLTIDVREEHIRRGDPSSAVSCPIALAAKAAGCPRPWVGFDCISPNWDGVSVPLDGYAREFVRLFDRGKPVKPFSFEIEVEG